MKTLVIGLGNPILGDDGVGWKVAEAVKRELAAQSLILQSSIDVDCFALGGLSLMERLVGYDRAILIDAVAAHQPVGAVSRCRLEDLPEHRSLHTASAHDTSLQNALRLGRQMGAHLPETVIVVGVEAEQLYDFSETLTPSVEAAVPQAAQVVLEVLRSFSQEA
jgi:hydrogenase maturation protease